MENAFIWFQQAIFMIALTVAGVLVVQRFTSIRKNIFLGKNTLTDNTPQKLRLLNMFKKAFGQQKMFDRPLVGILHGIIYMGFLIINIEVLEIILDGITGKHRIFAPYLGSVYGWLISFFEWFALGVVVACIIFWVRRNILPIQRFRSPELTGFPATDANTILIWEVVLMIALYTMNATDGVLQSRTNESTYIASHYPLVGSFSISSFLIPLWQDVNTNTLLFAERSAWWLHIVGIMGFAVYITYSKHLHILAAFFNTYFAKLSPRGKMENMPEIEAEVKNMLGITSTSQTSPPSRFGVKDVTDLSWQQILSAYACTECGRCTSVCPANITGKKLSPRKIMMDIRDRTDELGNFISQNSGVSEDGKALYGDYISKEELLACTSCNACVEACPIDINPLDIILQMRRYMTMEESATPQSWNMMFNNMENNGAPWAFSADDRLKF